MLSLILVIAIGGVAGRTYRLWESGPWELPKPTQGGGLPAGEGSKAKALKPRLTSTKDIVARNLFDPDRGTDAAELAEAGSASAQRVRSLSLLGTAIFGDSRYAIFQEPSDRAPTPRGAVPRPGDLLRLKLGDSIEGFDLSEIHEKKVVFVKDGAKIVLGLDYFRKVEETKQQRQPPQALRPPPVPVVPQVPRLPRERAARNPQTR